MLLLDAGVWIAAKAPDERYFEAARSLVLDTPRPVACLDLTLYEVANVVGARERRHAEAADLCRAVVARCLGNFVSVDDGLIRKALEVAAKHRLSAYDAAYVAVAEQNDWTLISTDIADLVSKGLAVAPDAADYPLSE